MTGILKFDHLQAIDRRSFLRFAAGLPACAGLAKARAEPSPEVTRLEPREQPITNIDARNLGLITTFRPELSPTENQARHRELWCELARCGRLLVRGCYELPNAWAIQAEAFLVFGNPDDSGNLKGLLRKLGRKYGQDAVLHKPYYGDARLYDLKSVPGVRLRQSGEKPLGRFRPELVGSYLTLITCRGANKLASADLRLNASWDRLGGRWQVISFWAYRGGLYPKQSLYRVHLDDHVQTQPVHDHANSLY